jgi:HK97 gp10 family phage protein
MRSGLRSGAKIIQNAIVQEAPKNTGFLSEHVDIKTRVSGSGLKGSAFIGPNSRAIYPAESERPTPGQKKSRTRTAAMIARWLEFGTSRMAAKPFVTRAFEGNKGAALDAIISKLKEVLGL